jgi:hypothetical protein
MQIVRKFVKLPSSDFVVLIQNEDASEMYLDALVLLDDLLCEFVANREAPRENDINSIVGDIATIRTTLSGYQEIQRNIEDNLIIAQNLRATAVKQRKARGAGHATGMEIENFLAELLEQYKSVAGAY